MTEITKQEWCDIANEIYYHKFINNGDSVLSRVSGSFEPFSYNHERFDAQRLRLADYLAEKGVIIYVDVLPTAFRMGADGIPEHTLKGFGDRLFHVLARHEDINMCRALAVLALIKEGKQ